MNRVNEKGSAPLFKYYFTGLTEIFKAMPKRYDFCHTINIFYQQKDYRKKKV